MLGFATVEELAARNLETEGFAPRSSRRDFKDLIERDGEVRGLESEWLRCDGTAIVVRENAVRFETKPAVPCIMTAPWRIHGRQGRSSAAGKRGAIRLVVETMSRSSG